MNSATSSNKTPTMRGSFKGRPTISLDAASRYPFTFGLAKARLIVEAIDEIRAFVDEASPKGWDRFDTQTEDNMRDQCGA